MDKQNNLYRLYYAIISFISALIGGIILLFVQHAFYSNYSLKYSDMVSIIASVMTAIATIVSAILMYQTFKFQRKTYIEEQFKSTYYSMLNYHRKLTDKLKVKTTVLNNDLFLKSKTYISRQCFLYAYKEVAQLVDVFGQDKYLGILKDNDRLRISYWESEREKYLEETEGQKKCDVEVAKAILEYRKKYYIGVYNVSEEYYNQSRKLVDKTVFAFQIFIRSWQICYEHYIRNLQQLLMFVQKDAPNIHLRSDYLNYVAFQMPKEELWFVAQYSQIDVSFRKYYIGSGMNKVVDTQLANK